jgi:6,7-dimethyl-8-ribityllumazine synthase
MKNVYIVVSDGWYPDQVNQFIKELAKLIQVQCVYRVKGCWEIPLETKRLISRIKEQIKNDYYSGTCQSGNFPKNIEDVVIIAIGAIVKGDTYHYEVLSQTVSDSLMGMSLDSGIQIVNQILNCYCESQIAPRLTPERARYLVELI